MSERPTPETDAETMRDEYDHVDSDLGPFAPSDTVTAEFARKLERQRDEAREERDKLQIMRNEFVAANKGAKINALVSNSLAGKLNKAERERDEAIESRKRWEKAAFDLFDLCEERRGK